MCLGLIESKIFLCYVQDDFVLIYRGSFCCIELRPDIHVSFFCVLAFMLFFFY